MRPEQAFGCGGYARLQALTLEDANPHKVSLLGKLGAEIVYYGKTSDVLEQKADQISRKNGSFYVHSFADPAAIAGQGTVGLEILRDLPQLDEVYVPIGGGGLISGIAVAIDQRWKRQPSPDRRTQASR